MTFILNPHTKVEKQSIFVTTLHARGRQVSGIVVSLQQAAGTLRLNYRKASPSFASLSIAFPCLAAAASKGMIISAQRIKD